MWSKKWPTDDIWTHKDGHAFLKDLPDGLPLFLPHAHLDTKPLSKMLQIFKKIRL